MNQILNIELTNLILLYVSVFSETLPVIFYLIFRKRINDKSLRVIFFLLIAGIASDFDGVFNITQQSNNSIPYNISILADTALLCIFFYEILQNQIVKRTILVVCLFFCIFWLQQFIKVDSRTHTLTGTHKFLNNCLVLEYITVLLLSLYYYYEKIIKINSEFIYVEPRFWVVSAYLIFIAGTFFLGLYTPSLKQDEIAKYDPLKYMFLLLRTILLSIAMFMKAQDLPKQKFTLT